MPDLATLHSFLPWVIFSPLMIAALGISVSMPMKRGRWIVHILAFVGMFLSMPAYYSVLAVVDPTIIELPAPGDGFAFLLWLWVVVPSIVIYAVYALFAWWWRRRAQRRGGATRVVLEAPIRGSR